MTYEELVEEAKAQGYRLTKIQPKVPHLKCKCGKRPHMWYIGLKGKQIRCDNCDLQSDVCDSEKLAWLSWNKMMEG